MRTRRFRIVSNLAGRHRTEWSSVQSGAFPEPRRSGAATTGECLPSPLPSAAGIPQAPPAHSSGVPESRPAKAGDAMAIAARLAVTGPGCGIEVNRDRWQDAPLDDNEPREAETGMPHTNARRRGGNGRNSGKSGRVRCFCFGGPEVGLAEALEVWVLKQGAGLNPMEIGGRISRSVATIWGRLRACVRAMQESEKRIKKTTSVLTETLRPNLGGRPLGRHPRPESSRGEWGSNDSRGCSAKGSRWPKLGKNGSGSVFRFFGICGT